MTCEYTHENPPPFDLDGAIPLGNVATPAGRCLVFPNTHQHKVGLLATSDSSIAIHTPLAVGRAVQPRGGSSRAQDCRLLPCGPCSANHLHPECARTEQAAMARYADNGSHVVRPILLHASTHVSLMLSIASGTWARTSALSLTMLSKPSSSTALSVCVLFDSCSTSSAHSPLVPAGFTLEEAEANRLVYKNALNEEVEREIELCEH